MKNKQMKIYNLGGLSNYNVGYLFLDTSSLIAIISYFKEFSDCLTTLKRNGRALVTIPSVAFEFSRTNNIANYNTRARFLKEFVSIYPIEKHLQNFTPLIPVLHKTNGRLSYPDFLLYCCLYQFPPSVLLTENHKDFTPTLLDRELTLTIDREDEKYNKVADEILKDK